jgi:hypothetical protein
MPSPNTHHLTPKDTASQAIPTNLRKFAKHHSIRAATDVLIIIYYLTPGVELSRVVQHHYSHYNHNA